MLLLQLQHGDEVGVSFGLARFILPYLQLQTAADAFRTISSMVTRLPFLAGRSDCHN
jgi:hypothetical protein